MKVCFECLIFFDKEIGVKGYISLWWCSLKCRKNTVLCIKDQKNCWGLYDHWYAHRDIGGRHELCGGCRGDGIKTELYTTNSCSRKRQKEDIDINLLLE
jgi:hypothetical protein